jgi:hypothetical protein
MSSEIIQSVTYDNYDDSKHVNLIFSQNFISLFWELFNDEINLRGKVTLIGIWNELIPINSSQ